MPDGHASNFRTRVDLDQGRIQGMKSHDCHVFMETLLPIAFSGLPERIWKPMTEISLFFKDLCSSTLREDNLSRMDYNITVITNKLEKILPPGFFDVMEHVVVHLVYEARLGGPVQYRWMYPFERCIGKLKRAIKQKSKVEGSMCEVYLAKETSHFCSYYFGNDVACLRNRPNRHYDGGVNNSLPEPISIFNRPGDGSKRRVRPLNQMEDKSASTHILLNCPEVQPYYDLFVEIHGQEKVYDQFATWFKNYVHNTPCGFYEQFLKDLSWGPIGTDCMDKYVVNGFKFNTQECANHMKTNNSGVWVKGADGVDFFGVIEEILELEYSGWPRKKIVLFRCNWFDPTPKRGTRVLQDSNIIEVNHTRRYAAYDPFIIAHTVKQVYYVPYPLRPDKSDWWVVIKTKPVGRVEVENDLPAAFQNDDTTHINQIVDPELETELEHAEHMLQEIDIEEVNEVLEENAEIGESETTDEGESSDDEESDEN
ncbi:uncharacterized protein LOC132057825 [Lycium ferocissimum]|uniref:uncharacterized protein LOC132057825 n=1 Tax=Lycium ferocissimum TaxID=112874 RepID=UPI002814A52B|nr:uncharacterized protein LOC132057825 [Lycium ferocissimum]